MMTADETLKVREIRKRAELGLEVLHEERQWILDVLNREGVPVSKEVYDGAKQLGFNVDGLKVKDND